MKRGLGPRARVERQRPQQPAIGPAALDEAAHHGPDDLGGRAPLPALRREELVPQPAALLEEAVVDVGEERVLVGEARVEGAHRRAGATGDLGDRRLFELAVAEQLDGGLEEAVERRAATGLLRRADGSHPNQNKYSDLEVLSRSRATWRKAEELIVDSATIEPDTKTV